MVMLWWYQLQGLRKKGVLNCMMRLPLVKRTQLLSLLLNSIFRYRIQNRVLRGISHRSLSTTVLGEQIQFPIGIAPTALHAAAHPGAEAETARGKISVKSTPWQARTQVWGEGCLGSNSPSIFLFVCVFWNPPHTHTHLKKNIKKCNRKEVTFKYSGQQKKCSVSKTAFFVFVPWCEVRAS